MSNQDSYTYLHTLLSCFLLNNQLYTLSKTPYFKQDIKYHTNRLSDLLGKQVDSDLSQLWGIEDETFEEILQQHEELMKLLGRANPNHIPVLASIVQKFLENPDEVSEMFEIKMIQK